MRHFLNILIIGALAILVPLLHAYQHQRDTGDDIAYCNELMHVDRDDASCPRIHPPHLDDHVDNRCTICSTGSKSLVAQESVLNSGAFQVLFVDSTPHAVHDLPLNPNSRGPPQ